MTRRLLLSVLLLTAAWPVSGETLQERLQSKLDELHRAAEFPGATVGVALPDGRLIRVSTGWSNIEEKTALRPDDLMLAGSTGKTFASAVILKAVENGKLKLDDPVEKWLGAEPWYSRLPNAHQLTLRMLMNHSSGITEHVLDPQFLAALHNDPDRIWKPAELVAYILDKPPLFPAGHGWSYADTNYILAAMVFEKATGRRYYDDLRRLILNPLHLTHTVPSDRRKIPGLISGYSNPRGPFHIDGATMIHGESIVNPQMEWTGGGVASTAGDLAKWAKLLYEGKVVSAASLKELLNGVDASKGRGSSPGETYGLAVQIRPTNWGTSYGHDGWFPGYLTSMVYYPDRRTAVAIQFNTDDQRKLKIPFAKYMEEMSRVVFAELP